MDTDFIIASTFHCNSDRNTNVTVIEIRLRKAKLFVRSTSKANVTWTPFITHAQSLGLTKMDSETFTIKKSESENQYSVLVDMKTKLKTSENQFNDSDTKSSPSDSDRAKGVAATDHFSVLLCKHLKELMMENCSSQDEDSMYVLPQVLILLC